MLSTLKKINFLITKRQRKGLVILTFLLFIGMIFEAFGLGILVPALSVLLNPDLLQSSEYLISLRDFMPNISTQNFIIFLLLAIVFVYGIKTIFLVFLTHKQNRFLSNITAYISNKLFSSYLNQPYKFHLNRNASELIKNIQVEINYLYAFLLSLITIVIESTLLVSVLCTLIYIEPLGAISIGVFYGLLSFLFYQLTKKKLKAWGEIRQDLDKDVSKLALEGLGGIKDLLILKRTDFFEDKYSIKNYLKARINSNQGTLTQAPRFFLELISILGLISFIILMLYQNKPIETLMSTVGVFVAATFRMIPSLNRIIASIQSLKFYLPSVDVIHNELSHYYASNDFQKNHVDFKFESNIKLKDVNFKFSEDTLVLNSVSLEIKKGEMIGIIGESGSGKSTLIDLIIGLNNPTSGLITIDDKYDISNFENWSSQVGYVPQTIYLSDDSIRNNIAFGLPENQINDTQINNAIEKAQLKSFIESLENGLETRVGERGVQLSGGQRQRIGVARALYNNPEVLILDEATSALDSLTEKELMKSILEFKGKITLIMIAHRLTTLKDCDIIYKMEKGKLIVSNLKK